MYAKYSDQSLPAHDKYHHENVRYYCYHSTDSSFTQECELHEAGDIFLFGAVFPISEPKSIIQNSFNNSLLDI